MPAGERGSSDFGTGDRPGGELLARTGTAVYGAADEPRVLVFGVVVSLDVKGASSSISAERAITDRIQPSDSPVQADHTEKAAKIPSKRFPNLKSTLGMRMAQGATPPKPQESFVAPPDPKRDALPLAHPAIIERRQLKVQLPPKDEKPKARVHPRAGRYAFFDRAVGWWFALGAMFLAGFVCAYVFRGKPEVSVTEATASAPSSALTWLDLLEPGPVSPKGQSANGVTSMQAFQFADASLHADPKSPDPEEARYWLRMGIGNALKDDRLRWAMTQLGTLYARPGATASDFAAARAVWEIAAAVKDPVALCFLARLEEGGYGAPADSTVALTLFQQADETGQCSGSEEAIERLGQRRQ